MKLERSVIAPVDLLVAWDRAAADMIGVGLGERADDGADP